MRSWHGLVFVFAVGGVAALSSVMACSGGSGGGGGSSSGSDSGSGSSSSGSSSGSSSSSSGSGSGSSSGSDGGPGGGDGGCPGCTEATPIPDDIDGGVMAFCQNQQLATGQSACDGLTGSDGGALCWCTFKSPVGNGSLCCATSQGACNNVGDGITSSWTTCFDYKGQLVADYYYGTYPCSSPGMPSGCGSPSSIPPNPNGLDGPTWDGTCSLGPIPPSSIAGGNCSIAPPGYVVPNALAPSDQPDGGCSLPENSNDAICTCSVAACP
jgi:hypothetical protein